MSLSFGCYCIYILVSIYIYIYICMHKGWLKSSYADQDTLMECDQGKLFFSLVPLAVKRLLLFMLYNLGLINKEVINSRYDVIIWTLQPITFSSHLYIYIHAYIYIYIIIIMSCRQHRYPWPSLATSPNYSSPLAGLQGYILCPHIAAVYIYIYIYI